MNIKKAIMTVVAVLAVFAAIIVGVIFSGQSNEEPDATGAASPSSSASAVPLPEQTLAPEPSVTASAKPSSKPTPTPTPSPSEDGVPAVRPALKSIDLEGFGWSPALENNLTAEERQAQSNIFKVIPVAANVASSKYKSPLGARDELLKQKLITGKMASTFSDKYTPFQSDINKSGFTVQTSGMKCMMRTISPQTALQLGKVTCYFTRAYVNERGEVSLSDFEKATGGIGAIDPDEIARVEVEVKKEGNTWKVDDLRFS